MSHDDDFEELLRREMRELSGTSISQADGDRLSAAVGGAASQRPQRLLDGRPVGGRALGRFFYPLAAAAVVMGVAIAAALVPGTSGRPRSTAAASAGSSATPAGVVVTYNTSAMAQACRASAANLPRDFPSAKAASILSECLGRIPTQSVVTKPVNTYVPPPPPATQSYPVGLIDGPLDYVFPADTFQGVNSWQGAIGSTFYQVTAGGVWADSRHTTTELAVAVATLPYPIPTGAIAKVIGYYRPLSDVAGKLTIVAASDGVLKLTGPGRPQYTFNVNTRKFG